MMVGSWSWVERACWGTVLLSHCIKGSVSKTPKRARKINLWLIFCYYKEISVMRRNEILHSLAVAHSNGMDDEEWYFINNTMLFNCHGCKC